MTTPKTQKRNKKHWYRFEFQECAECGKEMNSQTKFRMSGKKPDHWIDIYSYAQDHCGCNRLEVIQ